MIHAWPGICDPHFAFPFRLVTAVSQTIGIAFWISRIEWRVVDLMVQIQLLCAASFGLFERTSRRYRGQRSKRSSAE
jgi:hypothetical protein